MFELYLDRDPPAIDEWTLHTYLAQDTARGGFKQLEDHYKTFIVRRFPYHTVRQPLTES